MGNKNRNKQSAPKLAPVEKETFPRGLGIVLAIPVVVIVGLLVFVALPSKQPGATTKSETAPTLTPKPTGGSNAAATMAFAGSSNKPAAQPKVGTTNAPGAIKAAPDREEAVKLVTEGNDLLAAGKTKEAMAAYKAALKITPEDEDVLYNLGIAYARSGMTNEAVASYEKAIEIFPDYAEVHNNLGNMLISMGKMEKGIEHLMAAVKATPDNASAHNNLGTALGKQSKFREATLEFAQAAKLQPDYLEAHYNLANAYMLQSRIDEAIGEFNIVLRLNPGFESARRGLAFAQRKKAGATPAGPGGLISAPDAPKK